MYSIAFWSPYHGRGTTATSIAIALRLALNYDVKVLITHSQYTQSNMENAFLTGRESEELIKFTDKGIDSIDRLFKSGNISPEELQYYCDDLVTDRLFFLKGSRKSNKQLYSSLDDTILKIIDVSKKYYDFVLVDTNSGMSDKITQKVLTSADVIIINLDQTTKVLEDFFNNELDNEIFKDKKIIIVLSKYDSNSKYSKKFVKHTFNCKEVFAVPYNSEFMDSINDHSVIKFFHRNNKIVQDDNLIFFNNITEITNKLIEITKIDLTENIIGRNYLLSTIKNIFK